MRNVDEDTTVHDIVIDRWQELGNETRVIRSHRRPRNARHRGPVALIAVAAAIASGITATAVAAKPDTPTETVVANVQFVESPSDQEVALAEAFVQRQREEVATRSERVAQDRTAKPRKSTTTKTKPRVAATTHWASPVAKVKITSCYGPRNGRTHKGIDYDGDTGNKIRSVGAGTVVQAGWRYSGLGYSVVVRHSGGWMTLYGHLSKATARPGQKVTAGDLVGLMGSTGNSTGSHLHFGVAKTSNANAIFNSLVNPAPWLKTRGVSVGRCN